MTAFLAAITATLVVLCAVSVRAAIGDVRDYWRTGQRGDAVLLTAVNVFMVACTTGTVYAGVAYVT